MKQESQTNLEQLYKKNLKKSKLLDKLSPTVFYLTIGISILFMFLATSNSVGNVLNIFNKLDAEIYNSAEITEHYADLVNVWGEITLTEVSGMHLKFINIKKAFMNGTSTAFFITSILFFVLSLSLGKIILPYLAKMYKNSNEQMTDLAILKTQNMLTEKKEKKKEWF